MIDSTIDIYVSFAEGHQHEEILDPLDDCILAAMVNIDDTTFFSK